MGYVTAAVKGVKGVAKMGKAIKGAKQKKAAPSSTPRAAPSSTPRTAPSSALTKVEIHTAVMGALSEARANKLARANGVNRVSQQVDARVKPQLSKMLTAVRRQAIQRQATAEHNAINAETTFRKGTTSNLQSIAKRMDEITAGLQQITAALQLPGIAIVRRKLPIFGPKSVLQG